MTHIMTLIEFMHVRIEVVRDFDFIIVYHLGQPNVVSNALSGCNKPPFFILIIQGLDH